MQSDALPTENRSRSRRTDLLVTGYRCRYALRFSIPWAICAKTSSRRGCDSRESLRGVSELSAAVRIEHAPFQTIFVIFELSTRLCVTRESVSARRRDTKIKGVGIGFQTTHDHDQHRLLCGGAVSADI